MTVLRENNDSTARNVRFTNNVVVNAGAPGDATFALSSATSYQLTDNTFFGTATTPGTGTAGGTATGIGAHANGYRLCAGSPALGSGVAIAGNGGRDYFGNAIPAGAPNRGAYAGPGISSC
ncbi:hypothetical protein ABH920_009384 [Catenulispora sp. EB89]|uniref:hypothetical protein n=1 Tax=Catenulispora sp. EB89 TaxID=3156257 RepID=UPI003519A8E3